MNRRQFLKNSIVGVAALVAAPTLLLSKPKKISFVSTGFRITMNGNELVPCTEWTSKTADEIVDDIRNLQEVLEKENSVYHVGRNMIIPKRLLEGIV